MTSKFSQRLASPLNIWVTGASSGIGRALSIQLAQAGHRVVISARNAPALDEMAQQFPQQILPVPMDASDYESIRNAANAIGSLLPKLDLVILNAGTCEYLDENSIDIALVNRVMTINFNGTIQTAELARRFLEQSNNPALYVVSSQVTSLPLTRSAAYGASKAAIEYFFRCLRIDWFTKGIFIGIIRPGFVKTPLTDRNDFDMPWLWSADKAANKILSAIDNSKPEVTFPFALHTLLNLLGSLPHSWWAAMAQLMRKKKEAPQP